jgi:glutamate racemase
MSSPGNTFIGVFDSGFGGLTILRTIVKELPEYKYMYLGDTARTPYGSRSQELIYDFTKEAVNFLFARDCELVILACNTASSDALRKIQQEYLPACYPNKKALGVLIPAAEEAVSRTKNKKIGVIATEGSVRSGAFAREIAKRDPRVKVFQNACPLLVPLVEAGEHTSKPAGMILQEYLTPLLRRGIDTLILGCTHYGVLERQIKTIAGPRVCVISEARIVPKKLTSYLARHPEIQEQLGTSGQRQFYTTDSTPNFSKLGKTFFGASIKAKRVML